MSKYANKQPEQKFYRVELEVQAPVILNFRILASSPEEALEKVTQAGTMPAYNSPPQIIFARMRKLGAKVYQFGYSMLELTKRF